MLKSAYLDARYSSTYAVTAEELTTIAAWVRELRDRVEKVCRERIELLGEAHA